MSPVYRSSPSLPSFRDIICCSLEEKQLPMRWIISIAGGVEKRSVAARVAAIVLGVILSVVLLVGAVALTITELKKQKEEKTAEVFEAAPPGGAF